MSDLPSKAAIIIQQVAARMSAVGFSNQPIPSSKSDGRGGTVTSGCNAELHVSLTKTVEVWKVNDIVPTGPVYALVVNKGHVPLPAYHVVDFRVGSNIYGDSAR